MKLWWMIKLHIQCPSPLKTDQNQNNSEKERHWSQNQNDTEKERPCTKFKMKKKWSGLEIRGKEKLKADGWKN